MQLLSQAPTSWIATSGIRQLGSIRRKLESSLISVLCCTQQRVAGTYLILGGEDPIRQVLKGEVGMLIHIDEGHVQQQLLFCNSRREGGAFLGTPFSPTQLTGHSSPQNWDQSELTRLTHPPNCKTTLAESVPAFCRTQQNFPPVNMCSRFRLVQMWGVCVCKRSP